MFFVKQVLPIVLLSMVIGFAFTWYNSRSPEPATAEKVAELATDTTGAGKVQQPGATKQYRPATTVSNKPAIDMAKKTTVPMRVVKQPQKTPEPGQQKNTQAEAAPAKPVAEQKNRMVNANANVTPPVQSPPSEPATQKADPEFISDIESLINELDASPEKAGKNTVKATAGKKQPAPVQKASSQVKVPGWSADSFLDVIKQKAQPEAAQDKISNVISQAARRSEKQTTKDPYLDVLQDEATDLSVTAVDTAGKTDIIRNLPYSPAEALSPGADGDAVYIVKEGDTLSSIASDLFGDPNAYLQIYNANQDVLDSPDQVFKGTELRIPAR